jgi:hypothetical protein
MKDYCGRLCQVCLVGRVSCHDFIMFHISCSETKKLIISSYFFSVVGCQWQTYSLYTVNMPFWCNAVSLSCSWSAWHKMYWYSCSLLMHLVKSCVWWMSYLTPSQSPIYQGADKPLAQPTSLSVVFSVQRTGGCPTGPDLEYRVGDQTLETQVDQFLLGCKCPVSCFLPGWAKDLPSPL